MGSSQSKHPQSRFSAAYAPTGRAKCKKCGAAIASGSLRLSREVPSPMTGYKGTMEHHYHGTAGCGIAAVRSVRCKAKGLEETTSQVPTPQLVVSPGLSARDRDRLIRQFQQAVAEFEARCAR